MGRLLPFLLALLAICCGHFALAQQYRINVSFTNETGSLVRYFLTGGDGRECRLKSGESKNWAMSVDPPAPPTVTIHRPKGGDQTFPVKDKGLYVFRTGKDGKITLIDDSLQYRIDVTFTNQTGSLVRYHLTGGNGMECTLEKGASANWAMSVDPPAPPTVTIHQPQGGDDGASVKDGGRYVFRTNKAGKVVLKNE